MSQTKPHPPRSVQLRKYSFFWLGATAILLIAAFFRFYRLADLPLGLFFDPAINGLDAVRLMQRGGPVLFFPTNGGRESLFMFMLIPFIQTFGPTPFAVRALTAIISLVTVALLIGFLRTLPAISGVARPLAPPQSPPVGGKDRESPPQGGKGDSLSLRGVAVRATEAMPWLPLVAGLILAVSPWHIAVSRLGQRPILVPLLAVPIFWFLLTGWRSGHKRWFILAGLLLGLAGYTYSAARLLPLILLLALLPEFFGFRPGLEASEWRVTRFTFYISRFTRQTPNLLLFGLTAGLVYLPMAAYLLTHPAQFTARAGSVMVWNFLDTPGQIMVEIGRNALRVAGFFCCSGSPNPIFGPPHTPGLPLLLTPFLLIGLSACLRQWRDLFSRLVALWWLIGIAPSFIAIEAPHPWRMIVALVPTAVLTAMGLIAAVKWASGQASKFASLSGLPTGILAHLHTRRLAYLLIYLLLPTPFFFTAYFLHWPSQPVTQGIYDYGAVAIRDTILAQPPDRFPLYLPFNRFNDSTLLFYLSDAFPRQADLTAPVAERAWLIAGEGDQNETVWVRLEPGRATVLPPLTPAGQALIAQALDQEPGQPIRTGRGETVAHLTELPADPASFLEQPLVSATARFGPARLTGLHYPPQIDPTTATLPVTLFWQAQAPMSTEFEVVAQLVDDQRRVWADGSGRPLDWVYPTSFWRPGVDKIAGQHLLAFSQAPPPGRYWLALALFDPATGQRLPLSEAASEAPDTFFAGPLKVALPPPEPAQLAALAGGVSLLNQPATFGDRLRLAEVRLDGAAPVAGQSISLLLRWETLAPPDRDYTVFIHLLDEADTIVAGNDTQPLAGHYPTAIWSAGETVLDPHPLTIPPDLPPGRYRLALGLYHQPSGERLPLTVGTASPDLEGRLILAQPLLIAASK